jgi:hypothetical protein
MSETPSVEVEALLSALKPLADSGTLGTGDAAQAASRDSRFAYARRCRG